MDFSVFGKFIFENAGYFNSVFNRYEDKRLRCVSVRRDCLRILRFICKDHMPKDRKDTTLGVHSSEIDDFATTGAVCLLRNHSPYNARSNDQAD